MYAQDYPDMGVYFHTDTARDVLIAVPVYALINVTTGSLPHFVWNLKETSSYRPRSKGQYRTTYFRVAFPFWLDIGST